MFIKRRIALSGTEELALDPLIKAERLELCLSVEQILARANAQAAALVVDAERRAQQLIEAAEQQGAELAEQARLEAEQEVWRQADALLGGLRRAEQELWEEVEHHAEQVLQAALTTLLGEVAPQQRMQVLMRQLVDAQRQLSAATLYCTAEQQECVQSVLESEHLARWRVLPDPRLTADQLVLETDTGVFRCAWSAISDALSPGHDESDGTEGR